VRFAGGHVVDVRHLFADVVDVLQRERAAGDFHRNRTARLVGVALLRLLAARRLGVGAEVLRAIRRRRRRTGIAEAGPSEAAWTWTAKAAGPRAAKAPGTAWPRTETAGARTAGAAILAGARFADGERASVEDLPIEFLNRLLRMRAVLELDEREAARAAGLAIDGQDDLRRRRNGTEVASQVGFCGAVGEVSNEQADGQAVLSVPAKTLPDIRPSCKRGRPLTYS